MLDSATIAKLAAYVAGIVETDGGTCIDVRMGELADGSTRVHALVTMYDETNELEQVYRVISPAAWNSPAWASDYRSWCAEVRTGDSWMTLSLVDA